MMISTRFRHFILSTSHSTMLTSFRYELLTNQRFQYLILALLIITLICIILLFSSHQFELFFICGMIMLAIYCITFNMKMYGNDNESVLLSYVFFDKSNVSHEPKPIKKPSSKGINENKDRQIKYLDNMSSLFRSKEKADDSYNSFIDTLRKSKIGLETSYNKFKDLYEQFGKENDKIKDELLAVDISMAVYDYELNRLGKAIEERFTILGEDSNIKGSKLTENTDTNEMEDSSGREKNNLDDLVSACMDKTQDLYQLTGCEKEKSKQKQIEMEQPNEPPVVLIEPRPVGNPKNRSYSDKHKKPTNVTKIVDKDDHTPVIESKKSKEEIELDSQASHKLAIEKENMKLKTLHRLIASFVRESVFDTGKHLQNLFSHYTSHKKDKYHESEKERVKAQDDTENQRDKLAKKDQNTEPELQDKITRKKRSQINRIDAIDKNVENIDDFTQPEHMLYNVQIIFIVEGFYALIVLLLYLSNYIYIGMTVRAIFLACVMTDIVIAILLMLEAELLEMKCSSGDIDSCKTRKELAAKEVITKLNEFTKLPKNSADLKSIKSELGSIANKFETRNKKLQKYIAILADTTIIKIIETFDYLFKKLEFIEKDFEDIMQHKVSRSEYYTSIKKMKILLDNIESKVDDVKMSEVVELYADNVKINISYEREKDGIEDAMNTFMSEDAKDINKKNEDKCKHDVDKICKLGDKVDQLYFTLLVVSVILMICICV